MTQKRTSIDAGIRSVPEHPPISKRARQTPIAKNSDQSFHGTIDGRNLDLQHSTAANQMLEDIDGSPDQRSPPNSSSGLSESISSSSEQSDSDSDSEGESESENEQDEGDDGEEEENGIVNLGGPRKPTMSSNLVITGAADLKSRLTAFLPRLQQANRDLEGSGPESNLEHVGDEQEQYIEMNLGLGVLEEKKDRHEEGDSTDTDEDDRDDDDDEDKALGGEEGQRPSAKTERDIMGKLMGRKRGRQPAGIEVVDHDEGKSS